MAMFSLLSEVKLGLEGPSPVEPDECPLLMDSGLAEYWYCRVHLHLLRAVLDYIFIEPWDFANTPGPSRGRGEMAMAVASLARLPILRRTSDAVPCSLYSHSQRSCRPQPRGSDGDAAPRKDTRQDRRLSFLLPSTTYCCRVALRSLSVGELTGGRTSGIGVNAGTRVLVHGRNWWATDPSTGGHHPKNWSFRQVPLAVTF